MILAPRLLSETLTLQHVSLKIIKIFFQINVIDPILQMRRMQVTRGELCNQKLSQGSTAEFSMTFALLSFPGIKP